MLYIHVKPLYLVFAGTSPCKETVPSDTIVNPLTMYVTEVNLYIRGPLVTPYSSEGLI